MVVLLLTIGRSRPVPESVARPTGLCVWSYMLSSLRAKQSNQSIVILAPRMSRWIECAIKHQRCATEPTIWHRLSGPHLPVQLAGACALNLCLSASWGCMGNWRILRLTGQLPKFLSEFVHLYTKCAVITCQWIFCTLDVLIFWAFGRRVLHF